MFLVLHADDIVIFVCSKEEMQESIDVLSSYCNKWKLRVNCNRTEIMVLSKEGTLPNSSSFYSDRSPVEIGSKMIVLW